MILTKKDKEFLIKSGVPKEDFTQLQEAIPKTSYEVNGKRISAKKAIEILGRESYLIAMARSAFHWSTERTNKQSITVCFDSSRFFK